MPWGASLSRVFRPFGASIFISMGAPTRGYAPGYDVSPLWGDRPTREPSQRCRKDTAFYGSGFSCNPEAGLHPFLLEDPPKAFSDCLLRRSLRMGPTPRRGIGCQPRAEPWDGQIGSIFANSYEPRRGTTQPPMRHSHAMGDLFTPCVSPLRGLHFYFNGGPDPGLRPGL